MSMESNAFCEDVLNAVCDYCADGIDAFEKCLAGAPLLEPEVVDEIQKGTKLLGDDLLGRMESNLSLFQQFCGTTIFSVPLHPLLHKEDAPHAVAPSPLRFPVQSEQELDAKLAQLREQLTQASSDCSSLQQEVSELDQEIQEHGHIARHTAALASTLNISSAATASGQENLVPGIASSVAAIAAAVQKLQPLLQRAQKLRASRQPLAAVQNAAVTVEFKSSQMAKACGTMQDMQALRNTLNIA